MLDDFIEGHIKRVKGLIVVEFEGIQACMIFKEVEYICLGNKLEKSLLPLDIHYSIESFSLEPSYRFIKSYCQKSN